MDIAKSARYTVWAAKANEMLKYPVNSAVEKAYSLLEQSNLT